MKTKPREQLERIRHAIDETVIDSNPRLEVKIWQILGSAASDRLSRLGLQYAIEQGKLNATTAQWSAQDRESFGDATASPLRTLWWMHPITGDQMIFIPGGKAQLGNPTKLHQVSGFSMARYPVTNGQFAKFEAESNYGPNDDMKFGEFLKHWKGSAKHEQGSVGSPPSRLLQHPVTWVCLADALAYCEWSVSQLPSDEQWEKAARGCDGRSYPWGNTRPMDRFSPKNIARLAADSTAAVGKYPDTRSPWGCEDLVGNVSQWCLGQRKTYAGEAQQSVRGGCYFRTTNVTTLASHRRYLNPLRRNAWVGFRICVYTLQISRFHKEFMDAK